MHLWTYDSNPDELHHKVVPETSFGPEQALATLCADNLEHQKEEGDPLGPLAFGGERTGFWLVAARCGGRAWFYLAHLWTTSELTEEQARVTLLAFLRGAGADLDTEDDKEEWDEEAGEWVTR